MPFFEVFADEFEHAANVILYYCACDGAKVVHDDVYAPEDQFFLDALFLSDSSDVVEHSDGEPHPQIVLFTENFCSSVVDCVFEVVFADSQQHCLVFIEVVVHFSARRTPRIYSFLSRRLRSSPSPMKISMLRRV